MTTQPKSKLNMDQRRLGQQYIRHIINAIKGLAQQLQLSDQVQSSNSSKTL
jgi:hypothetical protein